MRILGVDVAVAEGASQLCACVVTRGSLWVDGAFVLRWRVDEVSSLAAEIKASRFYEELTAILLSSCLPLHGKLNDLFRLLQKPVLMVSADHECKLSEYAGLSVEEAKALLRTCKGPFGVEPLRLASLLAPLVKSLYKAWKRS